MTNEEIVAQIVQGGNRQELMLLLWQQNEALIAQTLRRFRGAGEFEDMVQNAYIGLDTAVRKYNPAAGVLFMTYATYWIRQAVQKQLDDTGNALRLPSHLRGKLAAYRKEVEALEAKLGHRPTQSEVTTFTDYTPEQAAKLEAAAAMQVQSLDAPMPGTEDSLTLAECLPDGRDDMQAIESRLFEEQRAKTLWGLVDALPGKQPGVMKARYGEALTVAQAADANGISREECRTEERRALRSLSSGKARKQLYPFYEDIAGKAMQGTGVGTFRHSWTSATERTALQLYGRG